jgi:protein-disulfide isomerase
MNLREHLTTVANVAVIGLVVFALVRPDGPVWAKVTTWKKNRAFSETLHTDWPRVTEGSRLDTTRAAVRLVEFSDYECPFCRKAYASLKHVMSDPRVGGVVHRHYPIVSIHEHAEGAARTAICAERQGKFAEMNDRLFLTDEWLKDTNWVREARAVGVADIAAFTACRSSPETNRRLSTDMAMAKTLGIEATPTFVYQYGTYSGLLPDTLFFRLTRRDTP